MYLWTPFLNYFCFLRDSFEKFISWNITSVVTNRYPRAKSRVEAGKMFILADRSAIEIFVRWLKYWSELKNEYFRICPAEFL